MSEQRKTPPKTFAEKFTRGGGICAIPLTHDKLWEIHHWWHEMTRAYHEPDPFRWALGVFIQTARGVTFMLQKEKGAFSDFKWYEEWVARAKEDPLLRWISDARTDVVHRKALAPQSWLEIVCIGRERGEDEDDHPLRFRPPDPFMCTHNFINMGPSADHSHEFTRFWSLDGLEGRELLEVGVDVYDRFDQLVADAHRRMGFEMSAHLGSDAAGVLPCMKETMQYRVVRTVVKDGVEGIEDRSLADFHR